MSGNDCQTVFFISSKGTILGVIHDNLSKQNSWNKINDEIAMNNVFKIHHASSNQERKFFGNTLIFTLILSAVLKI